MGPGCLILPTYRQLLPVLVQNIEFIDIVRISGIVDVETVGIANTILIATDIFQRSLKRQNNLLASNECWIKPITYTHIDESIVGLVNTLRSALHYLLHPFCIVSLFPLHISSSLGHRAFTE